MNLILEYQIDQPNKILKNYLTNNDDLKDITLIYDQDLETSQFNLLVSQLASKDPDFSNSILHPTPMISENGKTFRESIISEYASSTSPEYAKTIYSKNIFNGDPISKTQIYAKDIYARDFVLSDNHGLLNDKGSNITEKIY